MALLIEDITLPQCSQGTQSTQPAAEQNSRHGSVIHSAVSEAWQTMSMSKGRAAGVPLMFEAQTPGQAAAELGTKKKEEGRRKKEE
jgi:hypothetical protein